jgi:hypothetical protein
MTEKKASFGRLFLAFTGENALKGVTATVINPSPEPRKPKLLDQVREAIRLKHYSLRTEKTYLEWIKRFILFHGKRHVLRALSDGGLYVGYSANFRLRLVQHHEGTAIPTCSTSRAWE